MEHFSSKKLYLVSVSLFFVGCAAAAFSPNVYLLLLARVVQALGAGILLPLPQVVAFRLYRPEERGAIMGIVGLTTGFAPAFGPTFAGWVADAFGWRRQISVRTGFRKASGAKPIIFPVEQDTA